MSRRLAELPTQQMSESLKQEIVRRAERADRRRKRTGNAWQATAVAVGGSTLCLLGWRTFATLDPDLHPLLQSIAGTYLAAVQPLCLRYSHLYAALTAFYFAVNVLLERKRRNVGAPGYSNIFCTESIWR